MVILTRYLYVCKEGAIKAIVGIVGEKKLFELLFFVLARSLITKKKSTEQSQFPSAPGISSRLIRLRAGKNRKKREGKER
jgi:hypothetical protein